MVQIAALHGEFQLEIYRTNCVIIQRPCQNFAGKTGITAGRYNRNRYEDASPTTIRERLVHRRRREQIVSEQNRKRPCHLTVRILPSQGRYTGSIPVRATTQSSVQRNPAGFPQKCAENCQSLRSFVRFLNNRRGGPPKPCRGSGADRRRTKC